MNEIQKKRAKERRMKIYNHLANQVGGTSSTHKLHHRASVIAEFCVQDTGPNRCTMVDGYRVWCEMNGIPLSRENPEKGNVRVGFSLEYNLYDLFDTQYYETYNEHKQRMERRWENEQEALRDIIEMPHLDPLNTDGEE